MDYSNFSESLRQLQGSWSRSSSPATIAVTADELETAKVEVTYAAISTPEPTLLLLFRS